MSSEIKGISLLKILKRNFKKLVEDDLIKNLIGPQIIALLFGDGGMKKSLYGLYMSVCFLNDVQIEGFPDVKRKAKKIIYFQKEIREKNLKQRANSMRKELKLNKKDLDGIIFSRPFHLGVDDQNQLDTIVDYVRENEADLILIDPLADFHSKDENSNTDMRKVLNDVHYICDEAECGAIVIHHSGGTGGRTPRARMRGATSIWDACQTVIEMRYRGDETRIDFWKTNYRKEPPPFHFQLTKNLVPKYKGTLSKDLRRMKKELRKVLGKKKQAETREILQAIMKIKGCEKSAAEKELRNLVNGGGIMKIKHGIYKIR